MKVDNVDNALKTNENEILKKICPKFMRNLYE